MSDLDEIRRRIDIVDLVSRYVPDLKKSGRTYKARCPFHPERTPSFIVSPERQTWHCFGACGTGGDIFSFLMRAENIDFKEALRRLAEQAGVPLAASGSAHHRAEEHARLYAALDAAATFYTHWLLHRPEAEIARAHLRERGFAPDTWAAFGLGYSPPSWDALVRHLVGQGFQEDELVESGLAARRETGGLYDRFRNRLMIPIRDLKGRTLGFGARLLQGEGPKYINSPTTPIFDKSAVLFGIDRAAAAIRAADRAVIVEGYFDALAAHQAGALDVVASMGTAITPKQINQLKRLTKNLVLALDADAAGDEATLRGIEVAHEAFDRTVIPTPTWQGYVRYDTALDASIRILELPRGMDPDELVRRDLADWQARVAAAKPVTDYLFEVVAARLDLTRSKDKSRAVERLLPVIREIADPVQRAHYLQRLARLVQVDEQTLAAAAARMRPRAETATAPASEEEPTPRLADPQERLEVYILGLLARFPSLRARVAELEPDQFEHTAARELVERLRTATAEFLDTARMDNLNFGGGRRLPDMDEETAARAFADALRRLQQQRLRRSLQAITAMQSEARDAGEDWAANDLARQMVDLSTALGRLHRMAVRPGSVAHRWPARRRFR